MEAAKLCTTRRIAKRKQQGFNQKFARDTVTNCRFRLRSSSVPDQQSALGRSEPTLTVPASGCLRPLHSARQRTRTRQNERRPCPATGTPRAPSGLIQWPPQCPGTVCLRQRPHGACTVAVLSEERSTYAERLPLASTIVQSVALMVR